MIAEDNPVTYENPGVRHRRPPATFEEIGDRVRRIETRLTAYLTSKGFGTQTMRPVWFDGSMNIPSMDCSIKDILAAIPHGYFDDSDEVVVEVYHKANHAMSFYLPEPYRLRQSEE